MVFALAVVAATAFVVTRGRSTAPALAPLAAAVPVVAVDARALPPDEATAGLIAISLGEFAVVFEVDDEGVVAREPTDLDAAVAGCAEAEAAAWWGPAGRVRVHCVPRLDFDPNRGERYLPVLEAPAADVLAGFPGVKVTAAERTDLCPGEQIDSEEVTNTCAPVYGRDLVLTWNGTDHELQVTVEDRSDWAWGDGTSGGYTGRDYSVTTRLHSLVSFTDYAGWD